MRNRRGGSIRREREKNASKAAENAERCAVEEDSGEEACGGEERGVDGMRRNERRARSTVSGSRLGRRTRRIMPWHQRSCRLR